MDKISEEIHDYTSSVSVIDTHEHLPHRESEREQNTDLLKANLTHYLNRDLISAGLTYNDYEKVTDHFREGHFLIEKAKQIVKLFFYHNPHSLFNL